MFLIKSYIISLVTMLLLDGLWLGVLAKEFYKKHIGYLFGESVLWWPVFIFYPIYILGVIVFVVNPAIEAKSFVTLLWRGALLGLVAYGAYDLTNQATIGNWPFVVTLADIAWGVVVTVAVASVAYYLA